MTTGGWDPGRTFFFLHVMKTGGSSMLRNIIDNFPVGQVEPDTRLGGGPKPGEPPTYASLERLRSLPRARRDEVRVYAGHYPFWVTDLVPTDVIMTVLRDPVERTISFLRHCRRYEPGRADLALEEIYEGPWYFPFLVRDYQSKLFALRPSDDQPDRAHLATLEMDQARLDAALANLDRVDLLGFQHRYEELLDALRGRYGWTFPVEHRQRVATEEWPVSSSLRRRIEGDNAADVEFFRRALELADRRRAA